MGSNWTKKIYKEQFIGNDYCDFIGDEWSGRGFKIFKDGVWETSAYENGECSYATILWDACAAYYEKDGSYFEAQFDESSQSIVLTLNWKDKIFRLFSDCRTGEWKIIDVSGDGKAVSYDGSALYVHPAGQYRGNYLTSVKDIFKVYGKVMRPDTIPLPDICKHKFDGKVECIYSYNRSNINGVMLMTDEDNYKWYGECRGDKPGGFGIKATPHKDSTTFTWGMFGTNQYGWMPYESWNGGGQMCVQYSRPFDKNETRYIEVFSNFSYDRIYYRLGFTINGSKVVFKAQTPKWDTIEIDESFTSVRVRYANEDWKTYRI